MSNNLKELVREKMQHILSNFELVNNQFSIQENSIKLIDNSDLDVINESLRQNLKSNRTAIELLREEIEELEIILIDLLK